MEERTDNPAAVKVEKHSKYVILTYFQGDINSMVDAHFTRALNKGYKAKEPSAKTKQISKSIKMEDTTSFCHGGATDSYSKSQASPAEHLLTISSANDAPGPWQAFTARTGEGPGLSSITYSLSPDGLSLTGQQYATSLLNLLHSDRGEMTPVASSSKPELLPSWTVPQGFRESVDPTVAFEPGRHMDKKDLYWY